MPMVAVYTASKQAIEGFSGSLALEVEAFNVRVNRSSQVMPRPQASLPTARHAWRG